MPRKIKTSVAENAEVIEAATETTETTETTNPVKRGRKVKYESDDARRAARREQNRAYRERKKQELINLRRAAAAPALNPEPKEEAHSDDQLDAVPVE